MTRYVNTSRLPPSIHDEPLSYTAADVAKWLEQNGRPGFASLVRCIAETARTAASRQAELVARINELVAKHEPTQPMSEGGGTWTGD